MKRKLFGTIGVTAGLMVATLLLTQTPSQAASSQQSTRQVAQLYELQAAFHKAASGGGHLSDMLGLWTEDGSLTVLATGHTYAGKGVPGSPSCAPGSIRCATSSPTSLARSSRATTGSRSPRRSRRDSPCTGTGQMSTSSATTST